MGDRHRISLSVSHMERQTMTRWKALLSTVVLLATLPLLSQSGKTAAAAKGKQQAKTSGTQSSQPSDGERVFQQNCSRCHDAPQGFPPQISGTVVRHMRVRASLSQKDAQALLRFLNP
jgi:mono/diheme cytochrome c family protein